MDGMDDIRERLRAVEVQLQALNTQLFGDGQNGAIPRLEKLFTNHLAHHEAFSRRVFIVLNTTWATVLATLLAYIIKTLR